MENRKLSENTMVSRSLRIKPETLDVLKREAENLGLGITVYIRFLLEKHVNNRVQAEVSN